ncbi:MAG: hypothetical protein JF616_16670 [Fibrobacteres bacterium]|nr:hypothetical protein [Fibrobacterota bacterium]
MKGHDAPHARGNADRKLEWAIVVSLLAVAAGFPLFQAIHEAAEQKESPHVLELFRRAPTKENLHRWDDNAKDRSVFAKWLRPWALQKRYDVFKEVAPKSVPGAEGWLFYNQDVDYLLDPPYTDERFYKGTFDTLVAGKRVNLRNPLVAMEDFRAQLAARGIKLLLVPIPGKPSIYPDKLYAGFRGEAVSPTLGLLDDLKRRGFETVDLFTPLRRAKAEGRFQLYLKRDTHWTPQGLEIAADVLAARIKELAPGLDPEAGLGSGDSANARGPRFALKDTTIQRWGDIAEMTKVPERKSIWEEEAVEAHPVMDLATQKPYRDNPDSPILWLGDSFSRIYQTDAPGSAGVIAQVAYRLNCPLASIVNDGGASTVVRQQLARRPELLKGKKLVVWTFVERDLRFGSKGWALVGLP